MPEAVSRRERVMAALEAVLRAGVAPATVERNRRSATSEEDAPHVNLFDGGHTPDYGSAGDVHYAMDVSLEATVAARTDAGIGPAVNALYTQIIEAVMADPTLGGLCVQVSESRMDVTLASTDESARPLAFFSLDLVVEFHTPDGDPTG